MKVSIICTNYNKGDWIAEALDSFLAQETSFPFEIIVVDDASTDHSPELIQEYSQRHPDKIRAIFNPVNKGITQTWIDICQVAKGQYIARCDGDDYWTDPNKLQKQVDLLESRPQSRWSNTDFDMVTVSGEIIHKDVLSHRVIPFMDSYEKMLALKGMTMASTWLVEADLMREVNQVIAKDAVDDTFNIQLELFKRTELAFLPESTTVYRMDDESDSRTRNLEKIGQRFDRLVETQLEYVQKYPDTDFQKVLEYLLPQHNTFEKALAQRKEFSWHDQVVTIYLSRGQEETYRQDDSLVFPMQEFDQLKLELDENVTKIRVDLSEIPSYYKQVRLVNSESNLEIPPTWTNAKVLGEAYFFEELDPQIVYDLSQQASKSLVLNYEWLNVDFPQDKDFIANPLVEQVLSANRELEASRIRQDHLRQQLEEMTHQYNSVVTSRRWTIPTKLINFFRRNK